MSRPLALGDCRSRLLTLPDPLPLPDGRLKPRRRSGEIPPSMFVGGALRQAAVLVLLHPGDEGEARIVLTLRSAGEHRHANEVSLPGGAADPTDGSLEATALREAREEIGLDADQAGLALLGRLDPVSIAISGFSVTPVLAVAEQAPRLSPDPREVSALLSVPVELFLPTSPIEWHELPRADGVIRYGAYRFGTYRIWGATAQILAQLGALLAA